MKKLDSAIIITSTMILFPLLLCLVLLSLSRAIDSDCTAPCVPGDEDIMSKKEHGTSAVPVQDNLRWGCSKTLADRICNYNRHYAEDSGYWQHSSEFLAEIAELKKNNESMQFFDSNTGKLLFTAPKSRTWDDFRVESKSHGWPSFRDEEVNWKNVRVLPDGETVSLAGTHLGHNLPDKKGRRYCINLVSVAGRQIEE
mmetsp:Transcript_23414/g.50758  ORF Transcript_23414/g.50758 Transcript_23414/m.50758 type:complete len:198 (-) Transcript_23414:108-701(-)